MSPQPEPMLTIDAAAAAGHHRDRVPAKQEDRLDVDRHDPVPLLLRRLDDIGAANDPRRVDDDVEPAERGDGRLDQPAAVGLNGHVAVDRDGTPARGGDRGDHVGDPGVVEVGDHDGRPLQGEQHRRGPADAGRGSR